MIDTPIYWYYSDTGTIEVGFMASPSVRRATYKLVMDFTHLCS